MNKRCAMFVEIPSAVARISLVHILCAAVFGRSHLVHTGDGDVRLRMVLQFSLQSAIKFRNL
jgi:hypothetical protein